MSSLDYHLEQIKQSSDSLKTLYFRPPGMFTNSILQKPEITMLIRDADVHEQSLYKIQNGKPERIDGKRNYIDPDQSLVGANYNNQSSSNVFKAAVQIPKMISFDEEFELRTKDAKLNEVLNSITESGNECNTEVLCDAVEKLLEKYPIPGVREKVISYKQRFERLNGEILEYEQLVEEQKKQLSSFNINANDAELLKFQSEMGRYGNESEQDFDTEMEDIEVNIEDVLEEREQEIRELELKLIETQRKMGHS